MRWRAAVATAFLIAAIFATDGVARPRLPPAPPFGPITLPDVSLYLVQWRCPDGVLQIAEPACPGAQPQRASDPMRMRRRDLPAPDGFQAADSFVSDDGSYWVAIWSYPPFGPFTAANGD